MPPDVDWREREALFRHRLVAEAADPTLTPRERGALVRALAARAHPDPTGQLRRVARSTLDEWIRALRRGGFEALKPAERLVHPRTPLALLSEAEALRREAPERAGALIGEILRRRHGELAPSERTITRHLRRHGLTRGRLVGPERAFGRFEAARPNEMWTADVLHGPLVAGRKALLFGILDDHSRFVVAARFAYLETTLAFQQVLRPAFMSRGLPQVLYTDNGSCLASQPLERTLAVLGVRLVHSRPGRPQGRGKVERLFRTIREGFLVEASRRRLESLAELERLLGAWLGQVYHRRTHSETGESPQARYRRCEPRYPEPERLREAFLWRGERTVSATALVSLAGNRYEVAPELAGRRVELLYDPQDLTRIRVRHRGRDHGQAVPHRITRHVHQAAEDPTAPEPAPAGGIPYLELIERAEQDALRRQIAYRELEADDDGRPAAGGGR